MTNGTFRSQCRAFLVESHARALPAFVRLHSLWPVNGNPVTSPRELTKTVLTGNSREIMKTLPTGNPWKIMKNLPMGNPRELMKTLPREILWRS